MKFLDMSQYDDYPKSLRKGKYIFIICMLALSLISFGVFYLGVNIQSILLAFKKFVGFAEDGSEIYVWSWDNFRNIKIELTNGGTSSTQLRQAFKNSLFLFFAGNGVTIPTGCFISYYLWKKMRGYSFFSVIFYLPVILSSVVMVIMFRSFIAPNGFLGAMSIAIKGEPVPPWLSQEGSAMWCIFAYNTWVGFGGMYLLLTAALHRIPAEVIEAAQLDGITPMKEFFHICVPLVWPTLSIILLQKVASILAADGPILLLTNGNYGTYTLGFWSYMQVIVGHSYEFPAAVGIVMTLCVAPLAIGAWVIMSRINKDVEY